VQRSAQPPLPGLGVTSIGLGPRALGIDRDPRLHRAVDRRDPFEAAFDQRPRRQRAIAHLPGERANAAGSPTDCVMWRARRAVRRGDAPA